MLKFIEDTATRHVRLDCDQDGLQAVESALRTFRQRGHEIAPIQVSPGPGGAMDSFSVAMGLPGDIADAVLVDVARGAGLPAVATGASGDDVVFSAKVSDWRMEDGGDLEHELDERHAGHGELTVIRTSSGLLVDARPPGADAPHAVAVEFDMGKAKFIVYRGGVDEVQAVIRVDADGAVVEQDMEACSQPAMP